MLNAFNFLFKYLLVLSGFSCLHIIYLWRLRKCPEEKVQIDRSFGMLPYNIVHNQLIKQVEVNIGRLTLFFLV